MAPKNKRALVAGAGGFIGGHLVRHLLNRGYRVTAVDKKAGDDWYQVHDGADNWTLCDLSYRGQANAVMTDCDVVYNLAADMGGMGFIENNKALCMLSVLINTHLLQAAVEHEIQQYFFASSACVYNAEKQKDPDVTALKESDAYPAEAEDGYGWEKLFSERMCRHFNEDFGLDVRVARFHNVYGPHGTYKGGREKAPAAICRKVIEAIQTGDHSIEIWGDGDQTRSFMYIDDCIKGIDLMMNGSYTLPVNLGSAELVSINQLVTIAESFASLNLVRNHDLQAPQGVRGRNSDNTLFRRLYGWEPDTSLHDGLLKTYEWIYAQMKD